MATTPSTTSSTAPSIQVSKSEVLVDEQVRITIDGLHSNQKVSLLSTLEENKKIFTSCGHYVADEQGQVDTFVQHSHGGSFTGIQPMGLFTSTKEVFGSSRLMKLDVTTPYDVTLSVHDGHLDFELLAQKYMESRASPLALRSLKRWYMAPDVRRIYIHEGQMYGALFLPPGDGPFPGIVDVFGMVGGLKDYRAALLASHGFAVFALAYIAYKDLPTIPRDIKKTYFVEAADWLSRHPMVVRGGVGMVGHCFGGNFCLTAAALSPQVKAVASTNAYPLALGEGTQQFGDVTLKNLWFDPIGPIVTKDGVMYKDMFKDYTVKDHFLPAYEGRSTKGELFPHSPRFIHWMHQMRCLSVLGPQYRGDKSLWKRNLKVLIIVGEADQCTNVKVQREFEACIPSDRKHNFRFVYYPGAGHLIEPPYSPHCVSSFNKDYGWQELWGGDPEYHLRAQEEAWPEILAFLKTHLAMKSLL